MCKRSGLIISIFLLGLGLIGFMLITQGQVDKPAGQIDQPRQTKATKYQPLSTASLKTNRKLQYASIIYYAINHVHIQRWQEVSDLRSGWQVELSRTNDATRYLVWPDKNITSKEKQLTPNWFEISGRTVIYHSFEVHTAEEDEDQYDATTQDHIVKQINLDRAARKVWRMSGNLVVQNR
ncbi:hypothetical protein QUF07_05470 [Lentilactobacillus sp. TOM.63]|uniref:hypothetical protein n=1 Tax=Lentilactobacillus sp. TOM.63 TaxID=3055077 RepID=UPI0025A28467|nr:hypothetical protein [Lentilactobacillus sp. TOM.63]MDM7516161.1 hypothetical protein [Lentilactobacillus sp. TOM.63]